MKPSKELKQFTREFTISSFMSLFKIKDRLNRIADKVEALEKALKDKK